MMGTLLMALSYPTRRGRTDTPTRPSGGVGGRAPVYPANDRYYGSGGRPSYRPANKNLFNPSYFNPPKAGANPFQAPSAAVVKPDRGLAKSALGTFGKFAARATPYVALLEFAESVLPVGGGTYYHPNGANTGGPTLGNWERRYGPFTYGAPYHRAQAGWCKATANTWHAPITGQAQSGSHYVPFYTHPWQWGGNSFGIWIWNGNSSVSRFAHHSSWFRVGSIWAADNYNWNHRGLAVAPQPHWPLDPLSRPIGAASPAKPVPYPLVPYVGPNPYRSPIEQSHRGNAPPAPLYGSAVGLPGGAPIKPVPGISWTQTPGLPPRGGVYQPPARPQPPGPKVRERKFMGIGGGNYSALFSVIGSVTEGLDLVAAFWKALPKSHKTGYYRLHYRDPVTGEVKVYYKRRHKASASDKISDLVRGWDEIDVQKALSNAVDEAIQDYIYAGIGKGYQKARADLHRDINKDFNAQRAGYGKRARDLIKRRKGEDYRDFGPHGRGFQTGQGYWT